MVRHRASLAAAILILLALFLMSSQGPSDAYATSTTPVVDRLFYFTKPPPQPSLDAKQPTGSCSGCRGNLSNTPINFTLPSFLFSSLSISGVPSFAVWLSVNTSVVKTVQVQGIIREKPLNGPWSNSPPTQPASCPVSQPPAPPDPCTISGPATQLSLTFGTEVSVGVNATVPPRSFVTLYWGGTSTPSSVELPLSGYVTVGTVQILDWAQNAASSFNLNATKGQNVVFVAAPVTTAFGLDDIRNVNLTIVDSNQHPLLAGKNITMLQLPPISLPQETYPYIGEWTYPSNLPEGNYQVWITIVDAQGNVAFTLQGPYGFGLFRPGIHPLDLIPYVLAAGVGVAGGTFYYRRRKKKEYLSPFDHFYTLTAGSIPQGTMVTVEGNTGAGKTLLAEQLMYDDLKAGRPCVFVSTADFPMKIRGGIRSLGLEPEPYESKDALRFVDCYSAEAGQPSQEKFYVTSPGDLTSLGVKITSAISAPGEGPSVYFDSLTPLAPRSKPESIVSFAQTVGAKVRGLGGKVFFTVGSSLDESILRQLEESSDCIIQMEAFEEGGLLRRRMRITKFRNRRYHEGWVTFSIDESKGIIFYSKKPRK